MQWFDPRLPAACMSFLSIISWNKATAFIATLFLIAMNVRFTERQICLLYLLELPAFCLRSSVPRNPDALYTYSLSALGFAFLSFHEQC
jgi:hypothetical protein